MNILFVCTGNTCRSCMAEAIFNKFADDEYFTSSSCGISVIENSKVSENAFRTLYEKLQIDIRNRQAVQLTEKHLQESSYILVMTSGIKAVLVRKFPKISYKVFTVTEFSEINGEISDPYGMDIKAYENTFIQLSNCIENILRKLKEAKLIN